ncbi:MAG: amidohydrolase [Acidobacteria bacterium]|nr:amidohydrolase [Acidobacteriota bacterium]
MGLRILAVFPLASLLCAEIGTEERTRMIEGMNARAAHFGEVSRQIWEFAELGYKEQRSSGLLRSELQKAGFRTQENIGGMPTAFTAEWGSGKPVIGILGEYDALPGLSQDIHPERKPLVNGGSGHGCGHNLFGTASAFAAIAVKQWMEEKKIAGTLRFYGSPAEEGGGGKIYMIRAGAFRDVDVVLDWHPGSSNSAGLGSSLANISGKFRFYGKAAHAAGNPQLGRSALDALLLMSHGVELLREHVPATTRIHYIITKGGAAPNVVPDFTEGYFYARSPSMPVLDNVWDRIVKCAQAGALATETKLEVELVNSVYNKLPNEPISRVFYKHLQALGGVQYTDEERRFAETLQKSFTPEDGAALGSEATVLPFEAERASPGSTDVSDVSWVVPTASFRTATFVPGAPGHSWQNVACAGSSIGRKGMVLAAKVLALSAADLFTTPAAIVDARKDFDKRRAGHEYKSRVPADQKPPLNYRDNP